jgi:hypothetical protein
LDLEETSGHIRHRLQVVGAKADASELFTDETIARVYLHSQGVARLISRTCENALTTAFIRQLTSVSPDIVDEVAYDLRLGVAAPPRETAQAKPSGVAADDSPFSVL